MCVMPRLSRLIPLFALLILFLLIPQLTTTAHGDSAVTWQVRQDDDTVQLALAWHEPPAAGQDLDGPAGWPLVEMKGNRLPAQLVALRPTGTALAPAQIEHLESHPWRGDLPDAYVDQSALLNGAQHPTSGELASRLLPTLPIVRLREGRLRGLPVIVYAVTPLIQRDGQPHLVTALKVNLPGATLLEEDASRLPGLFTSAQSQETHLVRASQTGELSPYPHASRWALKIQVAQRGIQRVTGAAMEDAGTDLAHIDPATIQVHRNGVEIALEVRGTSDGKLTRASELRFYAPEPGDRWNATDTYWLTVGSTPGLRMGKRDVSPASAPVRTTAVENGSWQNNARYDSKLPGPDGDHWFAVDLRTGPDLPPAEVEVTLTPTLPLAPGETRLTIDGTAYTSGSHRLEARMGDHSDNVTWDGSGNWEHHLVLPVNHASVTLALMPELSSSGTVLDRISWRRPVSLNFGGHGAWFSGVSGVYRYELSNTPNARTLYDIDTPERPQRLTIPAGTTVQFQDGPVPSRYVLAGPGTLHTPAVRAHHAVDLATPLDSSALYIAPAQFRKALEPLVEWRRAQGHKVKVVDVQTIYDGWSFGQVDPNAIRNFLRHAYATWTPRPEAVTLVGDGTLDPLNYMGRNNTNFIPPYLAHVDPWMGETACESCYAQLDGDDPLEDPLPDVALGRLPVKSTAELESLVQKILYYEKNQGGIGWRSQALFIADDQEHPDGAPDGGGNYPDFADEIAASQPPGVAIHRVYYDPSATGEESLWREADPVRAHQRTVEAFNRGNGIVVYAGHASQWQWASTDLDATPPHLLGLYDVDGLTNDQRPSIVLGMTCLTGSFHQPAYSGTTIDERLLLHPSGGAIAVWSSTGLGVMYGHDALQQGFFDALWSGPTGRTPIGQLVLAGYLELHSNGNCCQSSLRTFALMGDPLTPARLVAAQEHFYLPSVQQP